MNDEYVGSLRQRLEDTEAQLIAVRAVAEQRFQDIQELKERLAACQRRRETLDDFIKAGG
jgi:hypothetical protein